MISSPPATIYNAVHIKMIVTIKTPVKSNLVLISNVFFLVCLSPYVSVSATPSVKKAAHKAEYFPSPDMQKNFNHSSVLRTNPEEYL